METGSLMVAMTPVLLLGARMGGLVLVAPAFSDRTIPALVKVLLVGTLTLLMIGAGGTVATGATLNAVTIVRETAIGGFLGLAAAMFVGGAEMAGSVVSIQMGLSGAQTLNPASGEGLPTTGHLLSLTATLLFLLAGGHLFLIEAVAESTRQIPIGAPLALDAGAAPMLRQASDLFELGLRIAAPVVAVLLVGNVVLGILGRAAPQLNVLLLAFPVQIGVGLLLLGVSLPALLVVFREWYAEHAAFVIGLIDLMSPIGGR